MKTSAGHNDLSRLSIRARAPVAASPSVRRLMQSNVNRTSTPERLLRSLIHRSGLRFRVNCRPEPSLRCTADVVFRRSKICVFVDGCYWHGCPTHFVVPRTNTDWWAEKILDNSRRDAIQTSRLESLGWLVIRVWEHELKMNVALAAVERVTEAVQLRSS